MTAIDVRLLRDVHQICRIPLDRGGGVRACDLCDPYAVILLVDGTLAVVEVVEKGEGAMEEGGGEEEATLQLTWPDIKEVGKEVRENNLHIYLSPRCNVLQTTQNVSMYYTSCSLFCTFSYLLLQVALYTVVFYKTAKLFSPTNVCSFCHFSFESRVQR